MTPYLILISVPMIIGIINDKIQFNARNRMLRRTKSLSIDTFMLMFLFLLAFRGISCGIDTKQYLFLFEQYSNSGFLSLLRYSDREMGYKLLNKLIGITGNDFQVLLIVTSFVCVCPIWFFYKKESDIPILTIVLFLAVAPFAIYFSGIRQSIAISAGVGAWYAAKNRKFWWFLFVVVFAMQFHSSAFILFFLYPLYRAKITKKWLWGVVPCMVAIYFLRNAIFNFLFAFLWKDYDISEETGAYMVTLLLILFLIYSYVLVDDKALDEDTIALRNILLFSVILQMFSMLHPLAMRFNYYFLIFVPILIPRIIKRCRKDFILIGQISAIVMTVYFLYYFVNMMITDNDALNIFPYIPFWKNP